jgi:hypothetical protein
MYFLAVILHISNPCVNLTVDLKEGGDLCLNLFPNNLFKRKEVADGK